MRKVMIINLLFALIFVISSSSLPAQDTVEKQNSFVVRALKNECKLLKNLFFSAPQKVVRRQSFSPKEIQDLHASGKRAAFFLAVLASAGFGTYNRHSLYSWWQLASKKMSEKLSEGYRDIHNFVTKMANDNPEKKTKPVQGKDDQKGKDSITKNGSSSQEPEKSKPHDTDSKDQQRVEQKEKSETSDNGNGARAEEESSSDDDESSDEPTPVDGAELPSKNKDTSTIESTKSKSQPVDPILSVNGNSVQGLGQSTPVPSPSPSMPRGKLPVPPAKKEDTVKGQTALSSTPSAERVNEGLTVQEVEQSESPETRPSVIADSENKEEPKEQKSTPSNATGTSSSTQGTVLGETPIKTTETSPQVKSSPQFEEPKKKSPQWLKNFVVRSEAEVKRMAPNARKKYKKKLGIWQKEQELLKAKARVKEQEWKAKELVKKLEEEKKLKEAAWEEEKKKKLERYNARNNQKNSAAPLSEPSSEQVGQQNNLPASTDTVSKKESEDQEKRKEEPSLYTTIRNSIFGVPVSDVSGNEEVSLPGKKQKTRPTVFSAWDSEKNSDKFKQIQEQAKKKRSDAKAEAAQVTNSANKIEEPISQPVVAAQNQSVPVPAAPDQKTKNSEDEDKKTEKDNDLPRDLTPEEKEAKRKADEDRWKKEAEERTSSSLQDSLTKRRKNIYGAEATIRMGEKDIDKLRQENKEEKKKGELQLSEKQKVLVEVIRKVEQKKSDPENDTKFNLLSPQQKALGMGLLKQIEALESKAIINQKIQGVRSKVHEEEEDKNQDFED